MHTTTLARRALPRRGYSMIGLLVTFACIVVLFVILMNALNRTMTGAGSVLEGTVRSRTDQITLYSFHQALVAHASDYGGRYLTPSALDGSGDPAVDTTANLFSALVMRCGMNPASLISANENSPNVWEIDSYDYAAYDPAAGVFWDPAFRADLADRSNTSFAHVPLFGERAKKHWTASLGSSFPVLGNRGPRDGVADPASRTYARDGRWAGHVLHADGRIQFIDAFTPAGSFYERDGGRAPDNIFMMEDGPRGGDAILAFTRKLTKEGPELQWD